MSKYGRQGDAAPHLRLAFGHGFSAILTVPCFRYILWFLARAEALSKSHNGIM